MHDPMKKLLLAGLVATAVAIACLVNLTHLENWVGRLIVDRMERLMGCPVSVCSTALSLLPPHLILNDLSLSIPCSQGSAGALSIERVELSVDISAPGGPGTGLLTLNAIGVRAAAIADNPGLTEFIKNFAHDGDPDDTQDSKISLLTIGRLCVRDGSILVKLSSDPAVADLRGINVDYRRGSEESQLSLRADGGEIRRTNLAEPIEELAARIIFTAEEGRIMDAVLSTGGIGLHGSGLLWRSGGETRIQGALEVDSRFAGLFGYSEAPRGCVEAIWEAAGDSGGWRLNAGLWVIESALFGVAGAVGEAALFVDHKSLNLFGLRLAGSAGEIHSAGSIMWGSSKEFDWRLEGLGLDLDLLAGWMDGKPDKELSGEIEANVDVWGALGADWTLAGSLRFEADSLQAGKWIGGPVSGSALICADRDGVYLSDAAGKWGEGLVLAEGFVGKDDCRVRLVSRNIEIAPFGILWAASPSGLMDAEAIVSGPPSGPDLLGSFEINDLAFREHPAGFLSGSFRRTEHELEVHDALWLCEKGEIHVRGSFNAARKIFYGVELMSRRFPLHVLGNLVPDRYRHLAGVGSGTIEGRAVLDGELAEASGSGSLTVSDAYVPGWGPLEADLTWSADGGRWRIDGLRGAAPGAEILAAGAVGSNREVMGRVEAVISELGRLPPLAKLAPSLEGGLVVNGQISGEAASPLFKGHALLSDVKWRRVDWGTLTFRLDADKSAVRAVAEGLDGCATAECVIGLGPGYPVDAHCSLRGLEAGRFLPTIDPDAKAVLSGEVWYEGDIQSPEQGCLMAIFTEARIAKGSLVAHNDETIRIIGRENRIEIFPVRIHGKNTILDLHGAFGPETGLDLYAAGTVELGLVDAFLPDDFTVAGNLDLSAWLSGSLSRPRLSGRASLSQGLLAWKGLPQRAEELTGELLLQEDHLVLDRLDGRLGGGTFQVHGSGNIGSRGIEKVNLSGLYEEVELRFPEWLPSRSSGSLFLTGRPGDLRLSGDIDVGMASFVKSINWDTMLEAFRVRLRPRRHVLVPPAPGKEDLRFDLRFRADDDLIIKSNVARAEWRGELRLVGNPAGFTALGGLTLVDGEIKIRGNPFQLTSGAVDFANPARVDPIIHVSAESEVKDTRIFITFQGTLDDYILDFSSAPPLDKGDILSLLALGITTKELDAHGGGITAVEAASVLTGGVQRNIEERIKRYVGVTTFRIESDYSPSSGGIEPRIVIGKEITPDLFATFSRGIGPGEEAGNEIRLEYSLTDHLSIMGEWRSRSEDSYGSFGGDLKVRYDLESLWPRWWKR